MRRARAFTLVEILVAVAILAIDGREVDPREILVFLPDGLGIAFRVGLTVRGLPKAVEGDAAGSVRALEK
jgi:prepilin-type N-terminal cleavage/methylation domain-containing protein